MSIAKYPKFYIFVEGPDDVTFFEKVIIPKLKKIYDSVTCITYAKTIDTEIENLVSIYENDDSADFIFVGDSDNSNPEVAKNKLKKRYKINHENKIYIVEKEIEAWYVAVFTLEGKKKMGITNLPKQTNDFTKEDFKLIFSDIKRLTYLKILKYTDIERGCKKNVTLKILCENLCR